MPQVGFGKGKMYADIIPNFEGREIVFARYLA